MEARDAVVLFGLVGSLVIFLGLLWWTAREDRRRMLRRLRLTEGDPLLIDADRLLTEGVLLACRTRQELEDLVNRGRVVEKEVATFKALNYSYQRWQRRR